MNTQYKAASVVVHEIDETQELWEQVTEGVREG